MSVDLKKQLAKFGKTLKTSAKRAETEGGFGADLPDGVYKTKLAECEIVKSKAAGEWQIKYVFEIIAGENEGDKIYKYQKIESEDDQVWMNRDFKRMGLEPAEDMDTVVKIVELLADQEPEVRVTLKSKDSGQFSYIDRLISDLDVGELGAAEPDDEDEESDEDEDEDEEEDEAPKGKKAKGKKSADEDDDADEDEDAEESEDEDADDEESEDEEEEEKPAKGKAKKSKDEDEESDDDEDEDESSDDDVEIDVGMTVSFKGKSGKTLTGKVTKILEDEEKVKVKVADKVFTVEAGDLFVPEEKPKSKKGK